MKLKTLDMLSYDSSNSLYASFVAYSDLAFRKSHYFRQRVEKNEQFSMDT